MPKRKDIGPTLCPLARAAEVVGDRWALLILREIYFGNRRFDGIRAQTGATPQMVSDRLRMLEREGIVVRTDPQARRSDYVLTGKGKDLFPVLYAMRNWGERWSGSSEPAIRYVHRECGHEVGLESTCPQCGEVLAYGAIKGTPSDALINEREARRNVPR